MKTNPITVNSSAGSANHTRDVDVDGSTQSSTVEPPTALSDLRPEPGAVVIISQPRCVQCDATYRALDRKCVTYTVIDATQDERANQLARDLGYLQAPVVLTRETSWSGFRPDHIAAFARGELQ